MKEEFYRRKPEGNNIYVRGDATPLITVYDRHYRKVDQEQLEGESWLSMRRRVEPALERAKEMHQSDIQYVLDKLNGHHK